MDGPSDGLNEPIYRWTSMWHCYYVSCSWQLKCSFIFKHHDYIRYHTECVTLTKHHYVEEDYPKCHMEFVGISRVQVVKCEVAKRRVRKSRPHHTCRRVGSRVCQQKKCQKEQQLMNKKCFKVQRVVWEQKPVERCNLRRLSRFSEKHVPWLIENISFCKSQ